MAWLISLGVLAALVIAGMIVVNVVNSSRTPEAAVERYLELIADGKGNEATDLVDPGVANPERAMLTDEVLGEADTEMTVLDVRTVSKFGKDAEVEARYSLNGEHFTYTFSVIEGKKELLFLKSWDVQTALVAEVNLNSDSFAALNVEGQNVPLVSESENWYTATLYAYPGTYTVAAPSGGTEYLTADSQEVKVAPTHPDDYFTADVYATPTDAAKEAVLQQVTDQVDSCATVAGNLNELCPYPVQSKTLASLEIKSTPTDFLSFDSGYFESAEGTITLVDNPSDWEEDPEPYDVDFTLYGEYQIDADGELTVTMDGNYYSSW